MESPNSTFTPNHHLTSPGCLRSPGPQLSIQHVWQLYGIHKLEW
jgi:hypothetical protein